jgi:hypothetical protein
MTRPKYAAELGELDRFAAWLVWYEAGRKGKRPKFDLPVPRWAWLIENEYRKAHPKPKPPHPPDPPKPPPAPPSWTMPGPLILTASDPGSANGHAGVGTIGRIVVSGVCPLWRCDNVAGPPRVGWLGQIEGEAQLDVALGMLSSKPAGDSKAIVGTGGVKADPMVAAGVNVCFIELNAQAGWEPYGNEARLEFQGYQDGWPHVYPSYGCYDEIGLQNYAEYVPDVWDPVSGTMIPGHEAQGIADEFAVFSAEGMGDTNSWPYLATL